MAGRRAKSGGETVGGKFFKGGQFVTKDALAIEAAQGRRGGADAARNVRIKWFDKEVVSKVKISMKNRVGLATKLVMAKVVENISRPVTKGTGPRGGKLVTNRSKEGEYFKAETTQAMKSVFSQVIESSSGVYDGYVGVPLSYPVILETKRNRKFLAASLNEERGRVNAILSGPLK